MEIKIDYGKIVTNALSALVAAVFVGAAAIVWQAATSVEDRIEQANNDIVQQQVSLKATQDIIVPKLTGMEESIEDIQAGLRSLSKLLEEAKALPPEIQYNPGEPIILDEFMIDKNPERSQQARDRINQQIDQRQTEIFQQRFPFE